MRITTARVKDGRVDIDAASLADGQLVTVVLLEEEPVRLTESERAWLRGTVEEAGKGEPTDAVRFLDELEAGS